MTNEPQTITAKAWLHMLGQGRFTCTELAERIGIPRKKMENLLFQMVDRGYAHRYTAGTRVNGTSYGVTATCKAPGGLPLADILLAARDRQPPARAMTTAKDRMKPAAMPEWTSADDPRIPRVVPNWTPPQMVAPRGA